MNADDARRLTEENRTVDVSKIVELIEERIRFTATKGQSSITDPHVFYNYPKNRLTHILTGSEYSEFKSTMESKGFKWNYLPDPDPGSILSGGTSEELSW